MADTLIKQLYCSQFTDNWTERTVELGEMGEDEFVLFLSIGLLPHYLKKKTLGSLIANRQEVKRPSAVRFAGLEVLEEKKRKKSRPKDTDSAVYTELIVMVEQSKNLERMQGARKQLQITVDVYIC